MSRMVMVPNEATMRRIHLTLLTTCLLMRETAAEAQALPGPPVRPLGDVVATAAGDFGHIQVRGLRDGRVIVNDGVRRLVWMLDASLANPRLLIDSAAGRPNSYLDLSGTLIAGVADTTLFFERRSQSLLILDPVGAITRVVRMPRPWSRRDSVLSGVVFRTITGEVMPNSADIFAFLLESGLPAMSARYGLVYSGERRIDVPRPPAGAVPGVEVTLTAPDSMALLTANLTTRATDTLTRLAMGRVTQVTYDGSKEKTLHWVEQLFEPRDQWAVLPDGAIAILHVQDYRVSWLNADGTRTESPRLPHPWRKLGTDDKARLVDSANTARQAEFDDLETRRVADSVAGRGRLMAGRNGAPPRWDNGILNTVPVPLDTTAAPDYLPPTTTNALALRADADGNLWIRAHVPGPGAGDVYDIVNRQGLVDRVQLPAGRALAGFPRDSSTSYPGTRASRFSSRHAYGSAENGS